MQAKVSVLFFVLFVFCFFVFCFCFCFCFVFGNKEASKTSEHVFVLYNVKPCFLAEFRSFLCQSSYNTTNGKEREK
jgi:hypothetical protein